MPDKKQPQKQDQDIYAEKTRQERTGREDPSDPQDVGNAKDTNTVRGDDKPQSVRHAG